MGLPCSCCQTSRIVSVIICVIISVITAAGSDKPTLLLSHVVFRHGDRSPINSFPTDPHQEDAWPQGFGQLSKRGMRQEYHLGQFLRQRYNGFINASYIRTEVYVRSTDVDRCLMSAQSVLASMYAPEGNQMWGEGLPWQPIPVHTVPKDTDPLLRPVPCASIEQDYDMALALPKYEKKMEEYRVLADSIRGYTGSVDEDEEDNSWNTTAGIINHLGRIHDTLFCELQHNMTIPEWAVGADFMRITDRIFLHNFPLRSHTIKQRRLMGGMLVGQMVDHMNLKVDPLLSQPTKLYMYSAHDTTVLMLLTALGVYEDSDIPYSSVVMVELHHSEDKGHFVQIWLRNDTSLPAVQLTLPGCTLDCPLELFVNLTEPVIPDNFWSECNGYFTFSFNKMSVVLAISVGAGLLAAILTACCALCCCSRTCCDNCCRRRKVRVYNKMGIDGFEHMPMIDGEGSDLE